MGQIYTVSILARLFSRALPKTIVLVPDGSNVSILARLFSRALRRILVINLIPIDVSILARLFSRALPIITGTLLVCTTFQSSPGFSAGRYFYIPYMGVFFSVSILARLFSRALHEICDIHRPDETVSILARLFSRALPFLEDFVNHNFLFQSSPGFSAGRYIADAPVNTHVCCFNPRPAFQPGATPYTAPCRFRMHGFNPRPAFQPGATRDYLQFDQLILVSILARLFSRALPANPFACRPAELFQSSPGFSAGRYADACIDEASLSMFQSSPGFSAGRYSVLPYFYPQSFMFQSSPGFSAGRYGTTITLSY